MDALRPWEDEPDLLTASEDDQAVPPSRMERSEMSDMFGMSDDGLASSIHAPPLTASLFDELLPPTASERELEPSHPVMDFAAEFHGGVQVTDGETASGHDLLTPRDQGGISGTGPPGARGGGRRGGGAEKVKRPRVRAPKGDPTKKHKVRSTLLGSRKPPLFALFGERDVMELRPIVFCLSVWWSGAATPRKAPVTCIAT